MFYNVREVAYIDGTVDTRIYRRAIEICKPEADNKKEKQKCIGNEEDNLRRSVARTKQSIYELAKNYWWDWFVTLTFSPDKVNRYDYVECTRKMSTWLNNLRKKCPGLVYLIVPEKHIDGAFHFHGLMAGLDGAPIKDSGKRTRGAVIYNLDSYKLGFSTMTEVIDNAAVTRYITKYITKELIFDAGGKKRYWASRNLERPTERKSYCNEVEKGLIWQELKDFASYENEISGDWQGVQYFTNTY